MPLLNAQTVADLQEACGAELVWGDPELLQRESMGFVGVRAGRGHPGDGRGDGRRVSAILGAGVTIVSIALGVVLGLSPWPVGNKLDPQAIAVASVRGFRGRCGAREGTSRTARGAMDAAVLRAFSFSTWSRSASTQWRPSWEMFRRDSALQFALPSSWQLAPQHPGPVRASPPRRAERKWPGLRAGIERHLHPQVFRWPPSTTTVVAGQVCEYFVRPSCRRGFTSNCRPQPGALSKTLLRTMERPAWPVSSW